MMRVPVPIETFAISGIFKSPGRVDAVSDHDVSSQRCVAIERRTPERGASTD